MGEAAGCTGLTTVMATVRVLERLGVRRIGMVAQGPIAIHRNENLSSTDKGVAQLRRQIRTGVRALQAGGLPAQPRRYGSGIVPTYNNETILHVPKDGNDDIAIIANFGRKVCRVAIESEAMPVGERQAFMEQTVRTMQAQGAYYPAREAARPVLEGAHV